MRIQPITTGYQTAVIRKREAKSPNFEGGWNSAKLNILARDEKGMKELAKVLWPFSDNALHDASVIKNFCGMPQTKSSMDAYYKLQNAVEPFRAEAKKVQEGLSVLVGKEYALREKATERVLDNSKEYVTKNFIQPFISLKLPSPSLLVYGSNDAASSDRFVYWAIKQAESLSENICYKSVSADRSQNDLRNALEVAKSAQLSYGDLTLFDVSMKVKQAKNQHDIDDIVELITKAKEIPGVAVIAGVKDDKNVPEAVRKAFDFMTDIKAEEVSLPENDKAELDFLKAKQQAFIAYFREHIKEYNSESRGVVAQAIKDIEAWGQPGSGVEIKNNY